MPRTRGTVLATAILCLAGLGAAAAPARPAPQAPSSPAAPEAEIPVPDAAVAVLREEIARLRQDYERRIAELEARLAALEAEGAPEAAPPPPAGAELEAIRAAAEAAAAEVAERGARPPPSGAAVEAGVGRERDLNRLNPEISFTGNVLGATSRTDREELRLQELELDLQAALDPFSTTRWTLAFSEEEGVDVEEGYVAYPSLWRGLGVTAGKFRQGFGVLNRWHLHALPQVEYPLVIQSHFGEEGLAQTGVSLEWLLPRGWAHSNRLTLQVTDGSADPFGGEDFERLAVLGHLSSYWDLSPSTYLELGVSGIAGGDGAGGDTRIWGADLTVDWAPPARAKYREVVWRTEAILSERDDPEAELGADPGRQAWGGYSYVEGLLARNLWAGVRYDLVEDPLEPDLRREAVVPYVTWWQSEYVRLRGEYRLFDDPAGELGDGFILQLTWAAGPHKHERY